AELKKNKISAKVSDLQTYKFAEIQKEELVLFIVSTQGDGEFPASSLGFYEALNAASVDLSHLQYGILGLGDSSYPLFCNAALLLDEALVSKNAKCFTTLIKADVDFTNEVQELISATLKYVTERTVPSTLQPLTLKPASTHEKKIFKGVVAKNILLNDIGSQKVTHHIEIDVDDHHIYQPGDALGIYPTNNTLEINKIINLLSIEPEKSIQIKEEEKSAFEWLQILNIRGLSKKTLDSIGTLTGIKNEFVKSDLYPFLLQSSGQINVEDLFEVLGKIPPRLYSIASSPNAHDGKIHLTVGLNTFQVLGQTHYGLASKHLIELSEGSDISFYIHKNNSFRLPSEEKDVIMIGPGTGIAPFRSFIAERDALGHSGKNWLFFGEQTFAYDFYYQTEIQEWLSTGALTKFNGAFSRDQKQKIYVQNRIQEHAHEFFQWLENGAIIYICGQKDPMSKDVENTILDIISQ
ncbi:MAG TPA: flavodoxin domain-containing protein, partial [Saprospiraceae bacterium]|nr:flavodoxin domain-containing protein [Saprospiraceae bacterium]